MLVSFLRKIDVPLESMRRDWNLVPNWISYARFVLCWTLIPLLVAGSHDVVWRWVAVAVFTVVAASDWIDGFIARRFNMTSDWGRFVDPIADKFLVILTALLIVIVDSNRFGIALFVVFFAISAAREAILPFQIWRKQRRVVSPTLLGKAKMLSQSILIGLWLVPPSAAFDIVVWSCTAVTIVIVLASWKEYYDKFVRDV